jgi:hypothetical protein
VPAERRQLVTRPVLSGPFYIIRDGGRYGKNFSNQYEAARHAREWTIEGCAVWVYGPEGFRTRLYLPERYDNRRWRYVVFCPRCNLSMDPDGRLKVCRTCWDPRESEKHMAAVAALNERRWG